MITTSIASQKETLADQLNISTQYIFYQGLYKKVDIKWFQFGNYAILKVLGDHNDIGSFCVERFGIVWTLYHYHDLSQDQLKGHIDKHHRLPAQCRSYNVAYGPRDLVLHVLNYLSTKKCTEKSSKEAQAWENYK